MTKIHTAPSGTHFVVSSPTQLETHPKRQFVTDISKASANRIVESLAKSTIEWKESASRIASLTELCGEVVAKNEAAASELGLLTEYQYTLHCLTN